MHWCETICLECVWYCAYWCLCQLYHPATLQPKCLAIVAAPQFRGFVLKFLLLQYGVPTFQMPAQKDTTSEMPYVISTEITCHAQSIIKKTLCTSEAPGVSTHRLSTFLASSPEMFHLHQDAPTSCRAVERPASSAPHSTCLSQEPQFQHAWSRAWFNSSLGFFDRSGLQHTIWKTQS